MCVCACVVLERLFSFESRLGTLFLLFKYYCLTFCRALFCLYNACIFIVIYNIRNYYSLHRPPPPRPHTHGEIARQELMGTKDHTCTRIKRISILWRNVCNPLLEKEKWFTLNFDTVLSPSLSKILIFAIKLRWNQTSVFIYLHLFIFHFKKKKKF